MTADAQIPEIDLVALEEAPDDAVKKSLGIGFWISVAWLVLIVVISLLAPVLPLADPEKIGLGSKFQSPGGEGWFGFDSNGRDVFSRVIWGSRVSLTVGFIAVVAGLLIGGPLGMMAGYFRGWVDRVVSFAFLILLSFPALILALLIVNSVETRSLRVVALTLGVLAIAPVGRLARANTIVFAEREFVQAARVVGAKNTRILTRELLPNVLIPMGALALLGVAILIVAEGGLAFLGLSVEEGATWGKMILEGSSPGALKDGPHVAMFPIGIMFLTVLALNYAGDKVREFFDVRETAF